MDICDDHVCDICDAHVCAVWLWVMCGYVLSVSALFGWQLYVNIHDAHVCTVWLTVMCGHTWCPCMYCLADSMWTCDAHVLTVWLTIMPIVFRQKDISITGHSLGPIIIAPLIPYHAVQRQHYHDYRLKIKSRQKLLVRVRDWIETFKSDRKLLILCSLTSTSPTSMT